MIDGLTSAQNSVQLAGYSATLRWQNTTTATDTQWIRVSGSTCATACTAGDQYRFRFYETTYSIPRFDNSDGRVTVIDAATLSALTCSAQFHFYTGPGVYLGSSNSPFNQRVATVLDTSTLAFAAGRSGHVIVSHTCGYGGLAGKAVTLEPATGFAQETQMVSRLP